MQKQRLLWFTITAFALLGFTGCGKDDPPDPCSSLSLNMTAVITNSNGTDGSINATATGSTGFTYNLNGGTFQSSGTFTNLAPGSYTIVAKDGTGCSVSKSFTVAATKTYNLSKSSWRFSGATVGGSDVSAFLQACQKDNTILFAAAGTGTLDEGATKCNAGDPQTSPYTWSFQSGETQLFISATLFTGGSSTFTLVTLSDTQLVLSQTITVGTPQTAVVTFIH